MECDTCKGIFPEDKYNAESFSPHTCFRCRIKGVKMGFGGYRKQFHGDDLVGGTIKSDNRHTVEMARSNGHDPVPTKTAGGIGVSGTELSRLKKIHSS